MGREIKFRAYGHLEGNDEYRMYPVHVLKHGWVPEYHKEVIYDHTLMQYAGRKDKNGTEIYESDVLKDQWGNKHIVAWDNEQAKFTFLGGCEWATVIGNIYENPELPEG